VIESDNLSHQRVPKHNIVRLTLTPAASRQEPADGQRK